MKTLRLITSILFILTITGQTNGQSTHKKIKTISDRKVKVKELDNLIKKTMDSLEIPGLSIAIINDAELVYHRVFGVKNRETSEPVDEETTFEAASLSKPVFAYFCMKMVDKGIVNLDEPLYKLLPDAPIKDNDERYKLITPRMVLSHSTGFPNWSNNKPIEIGFLPGTGFSYSGEAHQFLTAYLAVANKTNFKKGLDSIFQKEVAEPLGMNHSYFVGNNYFKTHKATGYVAGKPKELWLPKSFGAAHTLHSEALDFTKFLQAMIKGDGLSKKSYEEMLKEQNHFKEDNELRHTGQTGWALGFSMKPTPYGMRYLHTGNNTGFTSYCCFYKEKKYGLVLFTNCEKISELYEKIGKYLDDKF
jgi:CubicO group peptidase (beta-lactamase class C family)